MVGGGNGTLRVNQPQPSQVEIGEAIAEQQVKLGDKMVYSVTGRKTPRRTWPNRSQRTSLTASGRETWRWTSTPTPCGPRNWPSRAACPTPRNSSPPWRRKRRTCLSGFVVNNQAQVRVAQARQALVSDMQALEQRMAVQPRGPRAPSPDPGPQVPPTSSRIIPLSYPRTRHSGAAEPEAPEFSLADAAAQAGMRTMEIQNPDGTPISVTGRLSPNGRTLTYVTGVRPSSARPRSGLRRPSAAYRSSVATA